MEKQDIPTTFLAEKPKFVEVLMVPDNVHT
jgi:hypothetical protein